MSVQRWIILLVLLVVGAVSYRAYTRHSSSPPATTFSRATEGAMPQLPITEASPVLRTDFGNQAAWDAICDEIRNPSPEGFEAHVKFIDDRRFDRITKQQLLAALPPNYPHDFIVIVDNKAVSDPEHPLLVVNLCDGLGSEVGDEFRAIPSAIQAIENNLSISNMDFGEFAEAVDSTGLFRGF